MRTTFHRSAVVGLLLVLMSCGGGDDAAESVDAAESTAPPGTVADTPEVETTEGPSSDSNGAPGTGVIEIGDLRHELTIVRCVTIAGAISADAVSVIEPDNIQVDFSFSPEDWRERDASEGWTETGSVRLDSDDPYQQWESGSELFEMFNLPAGVQASDFDITAIDISSDGQSASGQATFVEINALLAGSDFEATPGSFAFACPQG